MLVDHVRCQVYSAACKSVARMSSCSHSYFFSIAAQIHEGDITILVSQNGRVKRGATCIREKLWDNAIVPYTINNSFSGETAENITHAQKYDTATYLSLSSCDIFLTFLCSG